MKMLQHTKGFTFIEILVVLAIIGILAGLSAVPFRNMFEKATIRSGAHEVYGALTHARTKSLGAEGDQIHGVHISSTTVTRFEGDTYTPGASGNVVYMFEGETRATSTLIANGGVVTFSRLIGKPSMAGSVYIYNAGRAGTTTVIIHPSGLVEYN